jgi:cytochrome bd-type quinol oxidase subunit 1
MGAPPSVQCLAAINEARRLRNQFITTCDRVRRLRRELTELIALAIVLYATAAAFTVAAVICFVQAGILAATPFTAWAAPIATGIGIGLLVAAALALAGAIAATVLAANKRSELAAAERELETSDAQFRTAAMNVNQTCCPGDFLDIDVMLPSCR